MTSPTIKNLTFDTTPSAYSIKLFLRTSAHKGLNPLQITRDQRAHSPIANMLFDTDELIAAITISSNVNGLDTITLTRDESIPFQTVADAQAFWVKLVTALDLYIQRFVNTNTLDKMQLLWPTQLNQMKVNSLADWETGFRRAGHDDATARRMALLSIVSSTTVVKDGGHMEYRDFSSQTGTMLIRMAGACGPCSNTGQTLGNPDNPLTFQGFMKKYTADLGSQQVLHVKQDGLKVIKMEVLPDSALPLVRAFAAAQNADATHFIKTIMTDAHFDNRADLPKLPPKPECNRVAMGMESDLYIRHNAFDRERFKRAVIIANDPAARDSMPQGWLPVPKIFVGEDAAVALTYARPGCDNGLVLLFGAKAAGNQTGMIVELKSADVKAGLFKAGDVSTVPAQTVIHLLTHLSDPRHACTTSLKTEATQRIPALTP